MGSGRPLRIAAVGAVLLALVAAGYAAAVTVVGTSGPDILRGTKRADVLRGKAGADWLYGYQGADRLYGDKGAIICRLVEEYGVAETIKVATPDEVEFRELEIPERFYPVGGHARESWRTLFYANLIADYLDDLGQHVRDPPSGDDGPQGQPARGGVDHPVDRRDRPPQGLRAVAGVRRGGGGRRRRRLAPSEPRHGLPPPSS